MEGKPLGVAITELTETLTNNINESGLPAYIVDLILFKLQVQVNDASIRQLDSENDEYLKQQTAKVK